MTLMPRSPVISFLNINVLVCLGFANCMTETVYTKRLSHFEGFEIMEGEKKAHE